MNTLSLGTHTGTHIDVPSHMVKSGKTLGDFSVDSFIAHAVCLPLESLTKEYVDSINTDVVDCIFVYTNWQKTATEDEYFSKYPIISEEVARALAIKKIKMFGTDCPSVDHEEFIIHKFY